MKSKWIILCLLISIIIHISVIIILGRGTISIPSFDLIETYFFEDNKKTSKNPPSQKETKDDTTQKQEDIAPIQNLSHQESFSNAESSNETNITDLNEEKALANSTLTPTHVFNPFTRFINEKMKFDIYWMGVYVGSAFMDVRGNEQEIIITSQVKSSGFISNFYYVNDHAQSKIEQGKPKHFTLIQVEGKYRGNKETIFDYSNNEIVFINHIKNNSTFHKGINKVFMDVLSGFFYLRSLPIKDKEEITIDIFDSNKFASVKIQIIGEEKLELSNKEVNAIIIKPLLDTEGLFKRKGDIIIWLSKDENKIPLRVETKVPVGKVVAELKEYKKN